MHKFVYYTVHMYVHAHVDILYIHTFAYACFILYICMLRYYTYAYLHNVHTYACFILYICMRVEILYSHMHVDLLYMCMFLYYTYVHMLSYCIYTC